jgi:hypothetical protein
MGTVFKTEREYFELMKAADKIGEKIRNNGG